MAVMDLTDRAVPDSSSIPSWYSHIGPLPHSCLGAAFVKVIVRTHLGFDISIVLDETDVRYLAAGCLTQHNSLLTNAGMLAATPALMLQRRKPEGACMHELHMFGTAIRAEQEGRGHLMGRVLPFQRIVPL